PGGAIHAFGTRQGTRFANFASRLIHAGAGLPINRWHRSEIAEVGEASDAMTTGAVVFFFGCLKRELSKAVSFVKSRTYRDKSEYDRPEYPPFHPKNAPRDLTTGIRSSAGLDAVDRSAPPGCRCCGRCGCSCRRWWSGATAFDVVMPGAGARARLSGDLVRRRRGRGFSPLARRRDESRRGEVENGSCLLRACGLAGGRGVLACVWEKGRGRGRRGTAGDGRGTGGRGNCAPAGEKDGRTDGGGETRKAKIFLADLSFF
ncbi:MAG: hypothetical protein BJ554DRAFT_4263, partial [Olpidium bornovanus]